MRLEVDWPLTKTTSRFDDVPLNQRLIVTEGNDDYVIEAMERVRLGGNR